MDRAESQKELNSLVGLCFKDKTKLSFEDFKQITETVTSEMFLCMFSLVKTRFPSFVQFKRYEQGLKRKSEMLLNSPNAARKLASPKVLSKFSQLSSIVKFSTPKVESRSLRVTKGEEEESKASAAAKPLLSKFGPKPKSSFAPSELSTKGDLPVSPVETKASSVASPLSAGPGTDSALFCECGKVIVDFDKLLCADCLHQLLESRCEGYLTKAGKKTIKKYWISIEKRELFCNRFVLLLGYEKKDAPVHKSMHSLAGCFLKEEQPEKIEGNMMYPFTLQYSVAKSTKYFASTKDECQIWINYIKKAVGYASLLDYYELKVHLGLQRIGKFGKGQVWHSA